MVVDPVTEDEIFARLCTALAREGLELHRGTLDGMKHDEHGRFFITRPGSDDLLESHVALEERARRAGVLKPNEAMVPAHGEGY